MACGLSDPVRADGAELPGAAERTRRGAGTGNEPLRRLRQGEGEGDQEEPRHGHLNNGGRRLTLPSWIRGTKGTEYRKWKKNEGIVEVGGIGWAVFC